MNAPQGGGEQDQDPQQDVDAAAHGKGAYREACPQATRIASCVLHASPTLHPAGAPVCTPDHAESSLCRGLVHTGTAMAQGSGLGESAQRNAGRHPWGGMWVIALVRNIGHCLLGGTWIIAPGEERGSSPPGRRMRGCQALTLCCRTEKTKDLQDPLKRTQEAWSRCIRGEDLREPRFPVRAAWSKLVGTKEVITTSGVMIATQNIREQKNQETQNPSDQPLKSFHLLLSSQGSQHV